MAKVDKNKKETKKKKTFMKDFKAELKRVTWLTPKQLVNNTTAVIVIVLVTAAIVFTLDITFKAVNTYGINKLKNAVETTQLEQTEENSEESIQTDDNENEEQTAQEKTAEASENAKQSEE